MVFIVSVFLITLCKNMKYVLSMHYIDFRGGYRQPSHDMIHNPIQGSRYDFVLQDMVFKVIYIWYFRLFIRFYSFFLHLKENRHMSNQMGFFLFFLVEQPLHCSACKTRLSQSRWPIAYCIVRNNCQMQFQQLGKQFFCCTWNIAMRTPPSRYVCRDKDRNTVFQHRYFDHTPRRLL